MEDIIKMKCALCGQEAKLMQSHIIPKLVYRRIRAFPNSRFRSMDNFGKELQDGEKRPMLCHDCEEKFSTLETWFANNFLDKYLKDETVPYVDNETNYQDYMLSVAWRILWDDLYRLDSFRDDIFREELGEFEDRLKNYLLSGGSRECFENKVFKLEDLITTSTNIMERALFGYTVYDPIYGSFVIVYYAGLVFTTRYVNSRRMVISIDTDVKSYEEVVAEEMVYMFSQFRDQLKVHYTPEFQEKIRKRYKIEK